MPGTRRRPCRRRAGGGVVARAAQQEQDHERGDREGGAGEQVRAGELGDAEPAPEVAADRRQVGSGDRADGRRPHHDRQQPSAHVRRRAVGGGVPGLQARRGAAPEQRGRHEQQPELVGDGGGDGEHAADETERVAGGEGRSPPAAPGQPRHRDREQCRAQHAHRLRQAGQRGGPRDLLRQKPSHRDAARDADAAEHLARDEDAHPAAQASGRGARGSTASAPAGTAAVVPAAAGSGAAGGRVVTPAPRAGTRRRGRRRRTGRGRCGPARRRRARTR